MNTTTNLPTIEHLATFFDGQPARTRAITNQILRDARALGWRPTLDFNVDALVIRSAVQLEVNEGACNHEAGYIAVYESADDYAEHSDLSPERLRAACLDELQAIVWGPES